MSPDREKDVVERADDLMQMSASGDECDLFIEATWELVPLLKAEIIRLRALSPSHGDGGKEECSLEKLHFAIINNTRGAKLFWIGEILLDELRKETGYPPSSPSPSSQGTETGK